MATLVHRSCVDARAGCRIADASSSVLATGTVGRQRGRRTLERGTSVLFAAARDLQLAELAGVVVHAGTSMESTSRKLRDLNSADLAGRIRGLCMAPLPGPRHDVEAAAGPSSSTTHDRTRRTRHHRRV